MPEWIKFYLDEMVSEAVAKGLRARGIDCIRTNEAGNLSQSDASQLDFARREGYAVFTRDSDFLELHAEGIEHCGIVYLPQQRRVSIGEIINSLCLLHDVITPQDIQNRVEYL
ncbi:MAG: DUF5615 family PIN-like protein [Vulcanimicrobiota bacterium]